MPVRKKRLEYYYNPVDTEKDVAVGIKLPFNKIGSQPYPIVATSGSLDKYNSKTGGLFELSYSTEEQAESNLRSLLFTRKGERMMQPTFGTDIWYYLFENMTSILKQKIKTDLNQDIRFWLPYIVIIDIKVEFFERGTSGIDGQGISIILRYKVTDQGAEQTVTIFVDESGINLE